VRPIAACFTSLLSLSRACSASLVVGHMAGTEHPLSCYVWWTKPPSRSFTVCRCSDFRPLSVHAGRDSGPSATSLRVSTVLGLGALLVGALSLQLPAAVTATRQQLVQWLCGIVLACTASLPRPGNSQLSTKL
jgi:hypothetical protein